MKKLFSAEQVAAVLKQAELGVLVAAGGRGHPAHW